MRNTVRKFFLYFNLLTIDITILQIWIITGHSPIMNDASLSCRYSISKSQETMLFLDAGYLSYSCLEKGQPINPVN
jgi:hypothetical protein